MQIELLQSDPPDRHPSGVETIIRLRGRYGGDELEPDAFVQLRELVHLLVESRSTRYRVAVRDDTVAFVPGNFAVAAFWPYQQESSGHVGELEIGTPGNRARREQGLPSLDTSTRQQLRTDGYTRPGKVGTYWRKTFAVHPAQSSNETHQASRQLVWLYEDARRHPSADHDVLVELWDLEPVILAGSAAVRRWQSATGLTSQDFMVMDMGIARGYFPHHDS